MQRCRNGLHIYTGPTYIKRQSDSDNFLTFWYTLLYISGPMSLTGALMQVSPGEYYAMVGFNMLLMLVVVDVHEA